MPRFRYEPFQLLDMQATPDHRVRISLTRSEHLRPGDELDLSPYGTWRIVTLERDPSPDVTSVIALHLPG